MFGIMPVMLTPPAVGASGPTVNGLTVNADGLVAAATAHPVLVYRLVAISSTKALVGYKNNSTGRFYVNLLTVSGTTVSYGTPLEVSTFSSSYCGMAVMSSSLVAVSINSGTRGYSYLVDVSGSSPTMVYAATQFSPSSTATYIDSVALDSTRFLLVFRGLGGAMQARVMTVVSGTSITAGASVYTIDASGSTAASIQKVASEKVVCTYSDGQVKVVVLNISGDAVTPVNETLVEALVPADTSLTALDATTLLVGYRSNTSPFPIRYAKITLSGDVPTPGTPASLISAGYEVNLVALTATNAMAVYTDYANSWPKARVIHSTGTALGTEKAVVNSVASYPFSTKMSDTQVMCAYYGPDSWLKARVLETYP